MDLSWLGGPAKAGPPPVAVSAPPPAPTAAVPERLAGIVPGRKPAPPPETAPTLEPETVPILETASLAGDEPAAAPPPLPALAIDAAELIGLDQPGIESVLGAPSLRQDAAPAKIWWYGAGECMLSVFFYLDLKDQRFRAVSYEFTGEDGGTDGERRCLGQILAEAP